MKKVIALLKRDFISTTRDAMLLYVVMAPIIIGLGVRLFLPAIGSSSTNLIITQADTPVLQEALAPYARLQIVADETALEQRVLAIDNAAGIINDGQGGYAVVLQGNEPAETALLPEMMLRYALGEHLVNAEITQLAGTTVPYRDWVGAFIALTVPFIASIAMALFIIEDKETGMLYTLSVSPLGKGTYILTRGLFVMGYSLVMVYVALLVLGITGAPVLPVLAMTAACSLAAILFGFIIGSLSASQVAGLANMKFGFLVILAPAILSLVLPSAYHAALYWVPFFWAFEGFREILVQGGSWATFWPSLLWTIVSSMAFIAILAPWLKKRLVVS